MDDNNRDPRTTTAGDRGVAVGGNVTNSQIVTGNGNTAFQIGSVGGDVNISGVASGVARIEDVRKVLAQLRAELENAPLDKEDREDVEGDLNALERQLSREEPRKETVEQRAKSILDVLSSAAATGERLLPFATRLVEMASSLVV